MDVAQGLGEPHILVSHSLAVISYVFLLLQVDFSKDLEICLDEILLISLFVCIKWIINHVTIRVNANKLHKRSTRIFILWRD